MPMIALMKLRRPLFSLSMFARGADVERAYSSMSRMPAMRNSLLRIEGRCIEGFSKAPLDNLRVLTIILFSVGMRHVEEWRGEWESSRYSSSETWRGSSWCPGPFSRSKSVGLRSGLLLKELSWRKGTTSGADADGLSGRRLCRDDD